MTTNKAMTTKGKQDRMPAEHYRIAQAQKLIDLFEGANGRPARTTKELVEWVDSPQGRAATAYHCNNDGKIMPDAGFAKEGRFTTNAVLHRRGPW